MRRGRLLMAALGICLFAYPALAEWTPAKRLTSDSGSSEQAVIAGDASGNLHVVWQDDRSGGTSPLIPPALCTLSGPTARPGTGSSITKRVRTKERPGPPIEGSPGRREMRCSRLWPLIPAASCMSYGTRIPLGTMSSITKRAQMREKPGRRQVDSLGLRKVPLSRP